MRRRRRWERRKWKHKIPKHEILTKSVFGLCVCVYDWILNSCTYCNQHSKAFFLFSSLCIYFFFVCIFLVFYAPFVGIRLNGNSSSFCLHVKSIQVSLCFYIYRAHQHYNMFGWLQRVENSEAKVHLFAGVLPRWKWTDCKITIHPVPFDLFSHIMLTKY